MPSTLTIITDGEKGIAIDADSELGSVIMSVIDRGNLSVRNSIQKQIDNGEVMSLNETLTMMKNMGFDL